MDASQLRFGDRHEAKYAIYGRFRIERVTEVVEKSWEPPGRSLRWLRSRLRQRLSPRSEL